MLARCLKKEPEQRYDHGAALVEAIAAVRAAAAPVAAPDHAAMAVASTLPTRAIAQGEDLPADAAVASTEPAVGQEPPGRPGGNTLVLNAEPAALGTARERIHARKKARDGSARGDPFEEARAVAAMARAVARVRGVVEGAIRSAVAEEGLPPFLLETTEESARATLRVVFEPAAAHDLHATLLVLFACSAPSGETGPALVQGCAAVLGSGVSFGTHEPPSGALETLYNETISDATLAEAVRVAMLTFFDAAQQAFGSLAPTSHVGWLRLGA